MLSETIVLTLAYILLIALLYAPKCPKMTATDSAPVDYFPEIEEPVEIAEEPEVIQVTETANTAIAPSPSITSPDLATMTIRQLKAMAKGKIKNYGNLTKAQLIDRLALA